MQIKADSNSWTGRGTGCEGTLFGDPSSRRRLRAVGLVFSGVQIGFGLASLFHTGEGIGWAMLALGAGLLMMSIGPISPDRGKADNA